MDKIEMQDLVELNDEFFNTTTKITKIKAPIAEVPYFEPEKIGDTVTLKVKSKVLSTSTIAVTSEVPFKTGNDLMELHNLDIDKTMFEALRNELKSSVSNKVIELLDESGSKFEELFLRTKVQKFFKKYFKSLEFPIYLNDETDISNSLCNKLMHLVNLITTKNYYSGRTKYLIVSPQIGSLLSDNINFIRVENNSSFNITVPDYIGYLIDVKVFINPYFTDNKVIIGSVSDDSPNINIVDYIDSFDCFEMMNPSYSTVRKYKLDKKCGIASVGNLDNHVASININLNKKPLWRRLLCL